MMRLAASAALVAAVCSAGGARAEWRVQELAPRSNAGATLDITYASSGEKFTILCGEVGVFITYSMGFRWQGARNTPIAGTYQIDDEPPRPMEWRSPGRTAFVTEPSASRFFKDIVGAARVLIRFGGVEQTFDLTPLRPHAARMQRLCRPFH